MLKSLGKLLGRDGDDDKPKLRAAVFGKHPGWSDHMEELGLTTPALVELRRSLYSEGIARIVDGGDWEGLDEADRLEAFDHAFARRWKGSLIVGRLWSSEDGRGRTKYPMIVAVEAEGLPAARAIELADPLCARAQAAFRATREAEDVRSAFATLARDLERAASHETASPEPVGRHVRALEAMAESGLFAGSDGASSREGVCRVIHALDTELGAQLGSVGAGTGSGSTSWTARARQVSERGGHIRGPGLASDHGGDRLRSGGSAGETVASLRGWLDLVEPLTGGRLALLVALSPGGAWVDVIAGEAGASALVCLRTSAGHTPVASEVPYEVPAETRRRVEDILGPSAPGAAGAPGPSGETQ